MVKYLTKKEVAEKYGVSARTINAFMKAGLPHYRLGDSPKNLRFREDEAEQWAGHFRVDDDEVDRIVNEVLS